MATIERFEDILAWQKARCLVNEIYSICRIGAISKDYQLRNQLQRAAISAMTNIAEGFSRHSHRDFAHFLDIARGSAAEVQSLLYIAKDVGYLNDQQFSAVYKQAGETVSLIAGFTNYLRRNYGNTPGSNNHE